MFSKSTLPLPFGGGISLHYLHELYSKDNNINVANILILHENIRMLFITVNLILYFSKATLTISFILIAEQKSRVLSTASICCLAISWLKALVIQSWDQSLVGVFSIARCPCEQQWQYMGSLEHVGTIDQFDELHDTFFSNTKHHLLWAFYSILRSCL